jgi:hypothetical protein
MNVNRPCLVLAAAWLAAGIGWLGGARVDAREPPQQNVQVMNGGQRGQMPPATGTAFLAGQVVESPGGAGVGGASVGLLVRGPAGRGGAPTQVIADSQGRFFFADLPAGSYAVLAAKTGYVALGNTGSSRPIDLADGERVIDIKARLTRLGSIAGTVRDDGGDPVVGSPILVFRKMLVNGRAVWRMFRQSTTDDRGTYRATSLIPGDYLLCSCGREACGRDLLPFDNVLLTTLAADPLQLMGVAARALKVGGDTASLDPSLRTYAPTFHPSSLTITRATSITLGSGEDRGGVDVDVTGARSTHVSGTIIGAIGAVQASSMRLVPAGDDPAAELTGYTPMLVQPDGRFDFTGVAPGQYVLRVVHTPTDPKGVAGPTGAALMFLGSGRAQGASQSNSAQLANEPPQWAAEPITVGDDGVSGVAVALRRASGISGRVQFVGAATQPTAQMLAQGAIVPNPVNPDAYAGLGFGNVGRLSTDGTFKIPGILPGRYLLVPRPFPGWPTLKSIAIAGVDMTDLPIEMEASDITDVVVTFSDTPMATLAGTVTGGAADASILVFPADRKYWADPAAGRRRFSSSTAGRTGTFAIGAVPAGEYFVIAVPDDDAADWQEVSRLETLSRSALRVQLADGDKKTIAVKR